MEYGSFDDRAATWDDDPTKVARARTVAQAIKEQVPLEPGWRVLEFGGGTGLLGRALADAVAHVLVTDAAPGMVEVASRRIAEFGLDERMSATVYDPTTHGADPGTFELVVSLLALHHVQDIDGVLGRLHGVLTPGGRLALADLDEDRDGGYHHGIEDFDGHHGFDRAALGTLLERAGFDEVAFTTATHLTKDVAGEKREFALFLVTARRPR